MGTLLMLAGGIVEPGAGRPGSVSAYVVLSAGRQSRIFKVRGPADRPVVTELGAETTVDLGRFQDELRGDLKPALDEVHAQGGAAAITLPKKEWVCGLVATHLRAAEGDAR